MLKNNINKLLRTTKKTNTILRKAGGVMLTSSFNTAKQIAYLYKDAGSRVFDLSKEVVKKTVSLTIDNQKELIKTSGKAIIEVAQSIRQSDVKAKASPNGSTKTSASHEKQPKSNKEITIDDLLRPL